MLKKLKIKFIALAMASLACLLTLIVAGMNIINYENVVKDADTRLEVIEENSARFLDERPDMPQHFDGEEPFFGKGGKRGPSMTPDEAEEARFFVVALNADGEEVRVNLQRIYSIDEEEATAMATKAIESKKTKGFIDDFRFNVDEGASGSTVTFLDCGRVLGSFRNFLKASILMSLIGLLVVFAVMCYFAERIVRPVAESYEKQKRFITDAGHEIKTPLAIIKANIDLMDMDLDESEIDKSELKEGLKDIDDQVDRLTGLTNDLVYLSRMEEAEQSLVMTEVPLSDIVSDTARSFELLAEEQGKAIKTNIEPMISVEGSTKELEKLLSIILQNAIKYSTPSDIELELRRDGKDALLQIKNETENELTNEMLSHVFERFYRTDSSRNSETGGHGIGLSVASAIVSAHGGKINARTSNGHDFIVTATIPIK